MLYGCGLEETLETVLAWTLLPMLRLNHLTTTDDVKDFVVVAVAARY